MSLIDRIKSDLDQARKDRNGFAVRVLTPLFGEAQMVGKNADNRAPNDREVEQTVKKFITNLTDTRPHLVKRGDETALGDLDREIALLQAYQPAQLSQEELAQAIDSFLSDHPDARMGDVMAHLKKAHDGRYDGRAASALVKARLG